MLTFTLVEIQFKTSVTYGAEGGGTKGASRLLEYSLQDFDNFSQRSFVEYEKMGEIHGSTQ